MRITIIDILTYSNIVRFIYIYIYIKERYNTAKLLPLIWICLPPSQEVSEVKRGSGVRDCSK